METIMEMLNTQIEDTLRDVADAKAKGTSGDELRALLTKLDKLHEKRMKELEFELKDMQHRDGDLLKTKEMDLKSAELELKVRQMSEELRVKEDELHQREAELTETKKSRRVRTVLDILGITVPAGVSCYWMFKGMKFEEEGKIYSGRTIRWLSDHLRLFGKKG